MTKGNTEAKIKERCLEYYMGEKNNEIGKEVSRQPKQSTAVGYEILNGWSD